MVEQIKMGTILIEEGVVFPDSLRVESEPYLNGWRIVKGLDGYGLDRKMSRSGMDLLLHGQMKSKAARSLLMEKNRFPRRSTRS